ncbi:MAG: phytanoyl-CoA dioxygenase [Gammaproteobacteria bacterium]|nr:MAG: phytanoyl-CoA dioxygenase [Gammaproteobacteria bacterium]
MAEHNEPLVVSRLDEHPDTLRERFQQYGYLHFRNAIPKARCETLLRDIMAVCEPHISADPLTQLPVLNGKPFFETDAVWDVVYPKIQALENFHRFFHETDALALMRIVTNKPVFVYPMKMARISTPKKIGYETPPHQDAHSHQAGNTMAGIWVALQDIDQSMGRLKMLPGSHKQGVRPVHQADGVGGVQCEIYPHETTWHVSDVGQGDVILFHSCCVHKAEPNTADKACRFSVDTRFCDYGAPVFVTNLEPHHGWRIPGHDWASMYRDWAHDDLKYYWKDYPAITDKLLADREQAA